MRGFPELGRALRETAFKGGVGFLTSAVLLLEWGEGCQ